MQSQYADLSAAFCQRNDSNNNRILSRYHSRRDLVSCAFLLWNVMHFFFVGLTRQRITEPSPPCKVYIQLAPRFPPCLLVIPCNPPGPSDALRVHEDHHEIRGRCRWPHHRTPFPSKSQRPRTLITPRPSASARGTRASDRRAARAPPRSTSPRERLPR